MIHWAHNGYKLYINLENVSELAFYNMGSQFKDDPIFNEWFKDRSGFMCVQSDGAWVLNIDDDCGRGGGGG